MSITTINVGVTANDGTGDTLRTGFQTVNSNFAYIAGILGGAATIVTGNVVTNTLVSNSATITNLISTNLVTSSLSAAGNISAGNISIAGNVVANYLQSATTAVIAGALTAGSLTSNSNVTASGAVIAGNILGAGFFYSNGVAVTGSTGNLILGGSTINGASETGPGGTVVLKLAPDLTQIANGQFLTLQAINPGGSQDIQLGTGTPSQADLVLGQSNNGIRVAATGSTGNITITPYGGTIIADGDISLTASHSVSIKGNVVGTGSIGYVTPTGQEFNLINLMGIQSVVTNGFGANIAGNIDISLIAPRTRYRSIDINASTNINYTDITGGVNRDVFIRNVTSTTKYIILPTSNNNKGSSNIAVAGNTTVLFSFVAFDATSANVVIMITNN